MLRGLPPSMPPPVRDPGPYALRLKPGPLPSYEQLSGYVPSSEAFSAWYNAEMCGRLRGVHADAAKRAAALCFPTQNARDVVVLMSLHDVSLQDGRRVALTVHACPGAEPVAVATWDEGPAAAAVDARTMKAALVLYFGSLFRAAVTVANPGPPSPESRPAHLAADLLAPRQITPPGAPRQISPTAAVFAPAGGAPPPAPPAPETASKRALVRQAMDGSALVCELVYDGVHVRNAVASLSYLNGPRNARGRGDRWLVEKLVRVSRPKKGASAYLKNIACLDQDRILRFFRDELCYVEGVRSLGDDNRGAVARLRLKEGVVCLRYQPLHLVFGEDPEDRAPLAAFSVEPTPEGGQLNDLFVRFSEPEADPHKAQARLDALRRYLAHYTVAQRVNTNHQRVGSAARAGRRAGAGLGDPSPSPEYGFILFSNTVARDAVLELGAVRVDGRTLHVKKRTYTAGHGSGIYEGDMEVAPKA